MSRLTILAAFVNLNAGARFYAPNATEPRVLNARETVNGPGEFETDDPEQEARLIRARCLAAPKGAAPSPEATTPAERQSALERDLGAAVSHAHGGTDAPSAKAPGEADDPRTEGGPSGADGAATGSEGGESQAPTGNADPATPPAGDAAGSPQAGAEGTGSPPAPEAGAGSPPVAGADGGRGGDGAESHRERRKRAREGGQGGKP